MRAFLKDHVFLPEGVGYAYVFLIYVVPLVIMAYPLNTLEKWWILVLLIVFYYYYRQGFIVDGNPDHLFLKQLAVGMVATLTIGYASLFIFFAFTFNYWPVNEATRRKYFMWYYAAVIISSGISLFIHRADFDMDAWLWIGVGLIFVLFSPFLAYILSKEQNRIYQLVVDNQRLETIVRQHERDRIARDLHDSLGQANSTIAIKAELAERLVDRNPQQAKEELVDIAQMSRENLNIVRRIVSDLNERTLAAAMLEVTDTLSNRGIVVRTKGEEVTGDWPLKIQHTLSAVIKEATTNILRHSQASLANYDFSEELAAYQLSIQDNGIGFQDSARKGASYGIQGMIHRVESIGGVLEMSNYRGARIEIKIDKERVDND